MSTAPPDVDYGETKQAQRNRETKAAEIAKHAWRSGMSPQALLVLGSTSRRAFARAAKVNPPDDDSPTWPLAAAKLDAYGTWAAANPGQAMPRDLMAADEGAAQAAPPPPPRPRAALSGDVVIPKGWESLAALPTLQRPGTGCLRCHQPSIIGTPDGYRCAEHPPQRGEWGSTLNWTWNKTSPCLPSRCYCGRCDHFTVA